MLYFAQWSPMRFPLVYLCVRICGIIFVTLGGRSVFDMLLNSFHDCLVQETVVGKSNWWCKAPSADPKGLCQNDSSS